MNDTRAATFIWDGGHPGQDNWSLNQNWNPNGAPANDGSANLVFSGTIRPRPNANGAWNINSITFDSFAGAFAISGDTLTLQGASVTHAIANNSAFGASFSNALTLASTQSWHANTGALTFSGAISLGANHLTLTGSSNITASGAISGTGGLTKAGTGTLTLTGANSYSGGTTVSAGTLQGTTSGLQGDITNNAAVVFDQTTSGTYAGVISGSGSLAQRGAGTVTLSSVQTFTGDTSIAGGTLALGNTDTLVTTTNVTLGSGATLALTGGNQTLASISGVGGINLGGNTLTTGSSGASTEISGAITGIGTLVKNGTGALTLSGANNFSGGTTVNAGTLVGSSESLPGNIALVDAATAVIFDQATNGTFAGVISGAGSLTKQNSGTLTLTATNSYAGTTTISGGTLSLGTAGAVSSSNVVLLGSGATLKLAAGPQTVGAIDGAGNIDLGSFALTTGGANTSTSITGDISGTGSLTKTGSGTLTLSGTNSYSGGTTVTAGTLVGNATSVQGNITNNASVVFDQAGTGTYAGAMSGTGSLTKENTGTLIVTGANTYSGGTIVTAGTLQGSSTTLQGNITNNAAVVFDQTGTGTYAGVMSGTGSLLKQNTGTLILSGANTHSGGTTIGGGTLQGSTASLQGNITNDATLTFDQASEGTFAGVISGAGALRKLNSGTLTLTGANTYSGGTTVSAGALQGNTTSLQGNITNNGAVIFDQSTTGSYSGIISGSGSVTKENSGTLTLTGANTFTGATTVNAGQLTLGGSNVLSSSTNLTLGSGTTLSLNGTSSQHVNSLSFTDATIDFGAPGTANYFLLGSVGTATGNLTIANWTSASNIFGIATNSVSQAFLDSLYFTGLNVGVGATISAATTNVPGYGAFYTLAPIPTFTWSGGQTAGNVADMDNWSKGGNWTGGIAPAVGAVKTLIFAGTVQTTNDMDAGYTINGMSFRSDAGAFTINSSTGDTLSIGSIGITNQSANTQTLNVPVYMNAGQTWTAASGNMVIAGAVTNGANTLTIDGAYDTTISGAIGSGAGGIVKDGAGTLTLSNDANTFSGGVTLKAGVVAVASDGNLGATSGGLTFNGGTLQTTGDVTSARSITLNASGGTIDASSGTNSTLTGIISGPGGLTKSGAGAVILEGANTYSGGTTVSAGILQGTTTSLQGNIRNDAAVVFNQTTAGTYSGNMSGTGSLTKTGSATLTLSGANSYTGGTFVNAGTLRLAANNLLASTTALTISSGATFDMTNLTQTVGSLAGTGTVALGSGTLRIGADNTNTTFGGIITGAGVIEKIGNGTLTFDANVMNIAGDLTLTGGTLALAGVNLNVGGTLRITGNTVLDFGVNSASILTANNVIIDSGVLLTITNWVDLQDFFYATGSFSGANPFTPGTTGSQGQGITPQNQVAFGGFSNNQTAWLPWDRQISPTPEPSTYGALMIGTALGFIGYRRWRVARASRP